MKRLLTVPDTALAHRIVWMLEEADIRAKVIPDEQVLGQSRWSVWIGDDRQELAAREIAGTVIPLEYTRDLRCPHCSYDLRGHAGRVRCPECGADVHAGELQRITCARCGHVHEATTRSAVCPSCGDLSAAEGGDQNCPHCGEMVPAHFERCWNCGAALARTRRGERVPAPSIRLATVADLPAILAISNHYVRTTPANFAIEPEPLEMWQRDFDATCERYPWLVALQSSPPSESGGRDECVIPEQSEAVANGNRPPHAVTRSQPGNGDDILGFAKASPWKGRCAYTYSAEITVYVQPDQRGRGIGRALYEMLFAVLRAQGYCTLLAGITLPNEASVKLHESMGMTRVALLERVGWKFDRWHDVGYWQAHLRGDAPPPKTIRNVADVFNDIESDRAPT